MPGVKIGRFLKEEHCIDVEYLPITPEQQRFLNDRLILVYTGKTRLAKNLLQVGIISTLYCSVPPVDCTIFAFRQ